MTDPCNKIRDRIADRIFGALSAEQKDALEKHTAVCPQCTLYVKALEGEASLLKEFRRELDAAMKTREDRVIEALNRTVSGKGEILSVWRTIAQSKITKLAAAAVLIIALLAAVKMLTKDESEPERPTKVVKEEQRGSDDTLKQPALVLEQELKRVDEMFAAGDIDGLVEMLEKGQWKAKIAAAGCLAKIGDARAIEALSRLAGQWQGSDAENPFAQAIEEIESRSKTEEPNDVETSGKQVVVVPQKPEFEPEGVLSGVISDANTGEPIKDVRVRIYCYDHGEQHTTTTDSNGVYSFKAIAKDGPYVIRLEAAEHITAEEWKRPLEPVQLKRNAQFVKDFELARGCKVTIKVADEKGQPVKDVRFYAAYVSDEVGRGPKDLVRSNEKGIVVIGGLKPSEYLINAWHRDYASAGRKVLLEQPRQTESIAFEMKKGTEVAGKAICSDGLPASGWEIDPTPNWWHSVTSPSGLPINDDGTFLLPHIVPGVYNVATRIRADDGSSSSVWSTDVNLPPKDGFLELRIPKPSPHNRVSISGSVKFVGGESARGTWIHVRSDSGHYGSTYLEKGQSEFTIGNLVPDLYTIDFTAGGAERKVYRNIKAPSEGLVLEIPVKKRIRLAGTVVDKQTGGPISKFRIAPAGTVDWQEISDPNGRFSIQTTGQDCQAVRVEAEGYALKTSPEICPDANEPVVIELGIGGAIEGTVVDRNGTPIAGAKINYRYKRSRDEESDGKYITSTDADGKFVIEELSPDSQSNWFVITHPDYAPLLKFIDVEEGCITEVELVLQRGGTVEGYAYDHRGKPLGGATLYFMSESQYSYWKENRARLGSVVTDSNGFYRLEHLPERLCYAFREDPEEQLGVVSTGVLPKNTETTRLDIGGKWRTTGRLLENGLPLANDRMLLNYEAGVAQAFKAYALTDSDGRLTFHGIPTGRWTLYFAIPGMRGWDKWAQLGGFEFESGEDLELGDLEVILAQLTVEMTPEDPNEPLEQWYVFIQQFNEKVFWGRRAGQLEPRNDVLDPYVFSGLVCGKYEAIAQRDNYPTIRGLFEIQQRQKEHRINLRIPSGSASLSGKITSDDPERSLPQLMLRSSDQAITTAIRPAGDGSYKIENLAAGNYVIGRASVALSRTSTLKEINLGSNEHKTLDIGVGPDAALSYNGYLVVLVVTDDGLLLPGTRVWLEGQGRIVEPHFDTDDGKSFAADAGMYILGAEYPGYRPVHKSIEIKAKEGLNIQDILKPLVITMQEE